jgi:hypothetical protein
VKARPQAGRRYIIHIYIIECIGAIDSYTLYYTCGGDLPICERALTGRPARAHRCSAHPLPAGRQDADALNNSVRCAVASDAGAVTLPALGRIAFLAGDRVALSGAAAAAAAGGGGGGADAEPLERIGFRAGTGSGDRAVVFEGSIEDVQVPPPPTRPLPCPTH